MTQGPATDNPVGYISHHLQPLQAGSGFWQFNIDTIFFSALLALIVMVISYRVGKSIQVGAPSGTQNVLETLIEFVNGLVKEAFPKPNKIVGPLGLTIFIWVFIFSMLVWLSLKALIGIRVSDDEEEFGVDISECGMEAYPEFVTK